jgi:hypothetical protein
MKLFAASLALALASHVALGADDSDKRTPLERYRGDTQFALMMCKISLRLALAVAAGGGQQDNKSDYASCITENKASAKLTLDKALRTVKKSKAQEALKSYHVAFSTAIEGIRPGADERKMSYEQRQQSLEEKLTEAWARFETEW